MFLLDITFHLHDLDLQMQGRNNSGWDLAAALCFPMLMEKWISASWKRGGPECKPAPNKAPTHKKKTCNKKRQMERNSGSWMAL